MPRRILVYVSKTTGTPFVRVDAPEVAREAADATLGLSNWREHDVTDLARGRLGELVNLARERQQTPDGTGRWRWRTIANVLKRWLGEPVDELCETCGQNWPAS